MTDTFSLAGSRDFLTIKEFTGIPGDEGHSRVT